MKRILLALSFLILTVATFSQIVPTQEWVRTFNGPDSLFDVAIDVDANGNIYVIGSSFSLATKNDIITIKYDKNGNTLFQQTFDSSGFDDRAFALFVDDQSNAYVTGQSQATGWITIKYDSSGVQQWASGFSALRPNDITVHNNNVYVTGTGSNDIKTVKYNSNGVQQWAATFNGTANLGDEAFSIAVDDTGNVYITGTANFIGSGEDMTTIKYNSSGVQQWLARFDGSGGPGLFDTDRALDLVLDKGNNVIITGRSGETGTNFDITTVKYNSSGVQQWVEHFDGTASSSDQANAITIDDNDKIYITGRSRDTATSNDYTTIKYNARGNQEWVQRHDGPANSNDEARDIVIDINNNVYITGGSQGIGTSEDYSTVAYSQFGKFLWEQRFDGSANSLDRANAIDVDTAGNVYITGQSTGAGTNFDFVTIKYSQQDTCTGQNLFADDPDACNDLFISEYIEGSGQNQAIEITNVSGRAVFLTRYFLRIFTNGAPTRLIQQLVGKPDSLVPTDRLAPGGIHIIANPNADSSILAKAVQVSNIINFNGDDAIQLLKVTNDALPGVIAVKDRGVTVSGHVTGGITANTVLDTLDVDTLDVIGITTVGPGNQGFAVGSGSTKNHTLIRGDFVSSGTTDWCLGQTQWLVAQQDDFSNLGSHESTCKAAGAADPFVQFVLSGETFLESDGDVEIFLEITDIPTTDIIVTIKHNTKDCESKFFAQRGGVDYTALTVVTFPANDGGQEPLLIEIIDDLIDEPTEIICFEIDFIVGDAKIGIPFSETVKITDNDYTGIDDLERDNIKIYPVLADNDLMIEGIRSNNELIISVHNVIGEIVISKDVEHIKDKIRLDVSSLSAGMYLLTLKQNGNFVTKKFIKQY